LALAGIITFDPYPFASLLFISSLLQLVFMFIIMVGQDVLGRAGTQRAEQNYIESEAPQDHPIRRTLPTVTF